jgi:hypothetical protein
MILAKKIILATILATASLFASSAGPREVQQGGWADGTMMAYQCQNGAMGKVQFLIVTTDGSKYPGQIDCGTGI